MEKDLFVGADLGGSYLRVLALDERGRTAHRHRGPSVPPEELGRKLRALWKTWRLPRAEALVVGSKGLWKKAPRRKVLAELKGLAREISLMSDVEMAYGNVLGNGPGVLILAGTGSIALARDRRGRWHRAGGRGPAKSDEGSAFWIGKEYRRRVLKKSTAITPASVRKTAALTAVVVRRAKKDVRCRNILGEAALHLGGLLESAGLAAGLALPLRAGMAGGLLKIPALRDRLKPVVGKRVRWRFARRPAEETAALTALGRRTP